MGPKSKTPKPAKVTKVPCRHCRPSKPQITCLYYPEHLVKVHQDTTCNLLVSNTIRMTSIMDVVVYYVFFLLTFILEIWGGGAGGGEIFLMLELGIMLG